MGHIGGLLASAREYFGLKTDRDHRAPAWVRDELPNIGEDTELDEFGVTRIVEPLCIQIESTEVPFTISLSGSWGVGKSTIAAAVVRRLRARGTAACYIDAWNEDVEGLRRRLAVEVGTQMLLGQRRSMSIADDWERLASETAMAREGIASFLDAEARTSVSRQSVAEPEFRWPRKLPQGAAVFLVFTLIIATFIWLTLLQDPDSRWITPLTSLLATAVGFLVFSSGLAIRVPMETRATAPATEAVAAAKRFAQLVTGDLSSLPDQIDRPDKTPARVLVVVDNIDRLTGEEAITALSSMRSLVEVPQSRCVFLVPVDRAALLRHLDVKLPSNSDDEPPDEGVSAAEDFLQKLFALNVPLTDPERYDLISFADRTARRLFATHSDDQTIEYAAQIAASAAESSPRMVQRVLNGAANRRAILAEDSNDGASPPLPTLVFVEGLIQLSPELVPQLTSSPRTLIDLRSAISPSVGPQDVEGLLDKSDLWFRGEAKLLARYLLSNAEVTLSAPELLTSLSLRPDRFWRDIEHGPDIEEAMRAGDADATQRLLPEQSTPERRAAVVRAIEFIERRAKRYPRDAFNNLNALVECITDDPEWGRLREVGLQVIAVSDGPQLSALLSDVGVRLLTGATGAHARRARSRLVGLLVEPTPGKDSAHLLRLIAGAADDLTSGEVTAVREVLPTLADNDTAPLFEPAPVLRLIEIDLAKAYIERLTSWTPAGDADAQSLTKTAAQRLRSAKLAGWSAASALDAVAEHVRAQFAASRPEDDAAAAFRAILRLLSEFETLAGNGPLAVELSNANWFYDAVGLPILDEAQRVSMIGRIDPWIRSGDLTKVKAFVQARKAQLDQYQSTYRDQLRQRWVGDEEPDALKMCLDIGEADAIVDAVMGLAPVKRLARAAELVTAVGGRGDSGTVRSMRDRVVAETPPGSSLDGIGVFARRTQEAGADPAPIGDLLGAHATAIDASTFHPFMERLSEVLDEVPRIAKPAAEVVTGKAIALGIASLNEALVIVKASSKRSEPARVLSGAVRRSTESADDLTDAVSSVRGRLRGDALVRLALVERASGVAPGATAEAATYLDEAAEWEKPTGEDARAHDDALERVASAHPDLIDTVARLKIA